MVSRCIFNSSLEGAKNIRRADSVLGWAFNGLPPAIRAFAWKLAERFLVYVVTTVCCMPTTTLVAEPRMCAVTEGALRKAATLRRLPVQASVPCVVRSRADIERFLRKNIAEKFPKETLAMEQLWYQALGVVPDDYPYEQEIVQVYAQQIGGYYDPDRKEFVMLDTMASKLQLPVAVHELTHALQDQKFGLTHFLDPKQRESDELMARAALVEGDATAIMQEFMSGRSVKASKDISEVSLPESTVKVPEALERILLFPYLDGLTFVRHVQRFGGFSAINAAFSNPPKSSREVLHPEQYINRSFVAQELPRDEVEQPNEKASPIYADTVGEFAVSALLGTALSSKQRGATCAEGWRRDRLVVFNGDGQKRFVSWMSEWDSQDESTEFYECYREMLKVRYEKDVGNDFVSVSPIKAMKIARFERRVSVLVALGSTDR
jgi:hypothetical protein